MPSFHPFAIIFLLLHSGTCFNVPIAVNLPQSHARHVSKLASGSDASIELNPIVASIKISKTVEVFSLVKEMEANGEKVTSLCVGEPDFPPSQVVLDAVIEAVQDGQTRYTAVTGTASLRKAISEDLKNRKGIFYPPENIVVGNGAKQCVYQGVLATCGPGDEVIIPAPYWPSYPEMVALVGATPVIVETDKADGYLLTPELLKGALTERSKLIIFCNPSNPTGGVHSRERLEELASILEEYPKVLVLADEIYERLVYEGSCEAMASVPGMYDKTMTINGFSKSYAMTGMRLGYLAAPTKLSKACTAIQSQLTSCASSISQAAGIAALTKVSEEEMDRNVEIMRAKRNFIISELQTIPGVSLECPPSGAFYVLPDLSSYYGGDDTQLCIDLLKQKKLALVPGSSFGSPGTVRISYATNIEELKEAMDKLREFLSEL